MKAASRVFWRTMTLFLAFVIGFATCVGAIFGVGFFVYEKVSFDTINDNITHLDTSKYFDKEKAEVSLTGLSIKGIVDEIKGLAELGDEVNYDLLVSRYGLNISADIQKFLTPEMREIPVSKLFSSEGIDTILKGLSVGKLMNYDKVANPGYSVGSEEPEFIWMKDGAKITGINGVLADYTLYQLVNEGVDVNKFASELTVASVLDLTCKEGLPVFTELNGSLTHIDDIEPIKVWYNGDGTRADKIMASVAESNVLDIGDKFNDLYISDVVGYVEYKDEFYTYDVSVVDGSEIILLEKTTGLTAEFADMSISAISGGGLDDKVKDIELSTVLGYTLGEDGNYYDQDEEVKGIMAILADKKVGEISGSVGSVKVGEVSGYTLVDGVWYKEYDETDPSKCVAASGVLGAMADLTVDEMTDEAKLSTKIETIAIADALGYTINEDDGKYYKNGEALTGVMAVVADTPIKDLQSKIDNSSTGELMGYELKLEPVLDENSVPVVDEFGNPVMKEVWYDGVDEHGAPIAVHPIMNKVASTGFKDLGGLPDTLVLGDVIPADKRTGMVSFIDESTPIDQIPAAVDKVFNETTLLELVNEGVITFEDKLDENGEVIESAEDRKNRFVEKSVAQWTMPQVMDFLLTVEDSTLAPTP